MSCKNCKSERIISVSGKTADLFSAETSDGSYHGQVPRELEIGGGDYMQFSYCANCGCIQGDFPIDEEILNDFIQQG